MRKRHILLILATVFTSLFINLGFSGNSYAEINKKVEEDVLCLIEKGAVDYKGQRFTLALQTYDEAMTVIEKIIIKEPENRRILLLKELLESKINECKSEIYKIEQEIDSRFSYKKKLEEIYSLIDNAQRDRSEQRFYVALKKYSQAKKDIESILESVPEWEEARLLLSLLKSKENSCREEIDRLDARQADERAFLKRIEEIMGIVELAAKDEESQRYLIALQKYSHSLRLLENLGQDFPDKKRRISITEEMVQMKITGCREKIEKIEKEIEMGIAAAPPPPEAVIEKPRILEKLIEEERIPREEKKAVRKMRLPEKPVEKKEISIEEEKPVEEAALEKPKPKPPVRKIRIRIPPLHSYVKTSAKVLFGRVKTFIVRSRKAGREANQKAYLINQKRRANIKKGMTNILSGSKAKITEAKSSIISYFRRAGEFIKKKIIEKKKALIKVEVEKPPLKEEVREEVEKEVEKVREKEIVEKPIPTEKPELRIGIPSEKVEWVEAKGETLVTDKEFVGAAILRGISLKRKGEVIPLDKPILVKNGDIWFPILDLSEKLSLTFIITDKDSFILIRDDGLPLEIKTGSKDVEANKKPFLTLRNPVHRYKGEPYIEVKDLNSLFNKEFVWDAAGKMLILVEEEEVVAFQVFEKPKPEKPEVEKPGVPKPPISPAMERFTEKRLMPAPPEIQPDAKLHISQYGTYTHDNITKNRIRTYTLNTAGYIHDYKVDSYFRWRDEETGTLVNEGKFIGIYGKDFWVRALGLNVDLYPLRSQGEGYEGFSFSQFHEPFSATYYAGRKEITVPGPSDIGSVKYFGKLAGVQNKLDLDFLDLKGDILYITNEAETTEKRGRVDFPRRNLILKGDAEVLLPFDIKLAGQYAFCNYNPDNLKEELIQDYNWRVEAGLDKKLFSLRNVSEFVGTDYASLSFPSNYQDYIGSSTSFTLRPLKFISFGSGYTVSKNNVDNVDSQPTTDSELFSLGSSISLPDDSNIGLSWSRSYTETTGPGQDYVEALGSYGYNYRITYSKSWAQNLSLYANYTRSETDYFGSDNDAWSDIYMVSLYKFIPAFKGSYVRLRHQMRKDWYMASGNFTTINRDTSLGIRFYPVRQLSLYTDWDLDMTESENRSDTAFLIAKAGATLVLAKDIQFGFDYTFNSTDLNHFSRKDYNDWSILFRGHMGFDVGPPEKWAKVKGIVFADLNANGIYDIGEPGIKDIIVKVPNEVMAMTNGKGYYHIKRLTPGMKIIKIDEKTLPFGLALMGINEFAFEAKKYQTEKIDFPLVEVSSISGKLFVDEDGNGTFEIGEDGVEFVTVYLNDTFGWAVTDDNGNFSFEFLPPGKYKITFNTDDIPKIYDRQSVKELTVDLQQGQKLENIHIPVRKKEIIKRVF